MRRVSATLVPKRMLCASRLTRPRMSSSPVRSARCLSASVLGIEAEILDDAPALEIFVESPGNDGPGVAFPDLIPNVANRGLGTDPECDLNYAHGGMIERDVEVAISNSFGFGGHNVCLAVRRWQD